MMTYQAECIIDEQNQLGEGPVWDDRLQEIFWVDIEGCTLHRLRPSDGRRTQHQFPHKIGAAVPAQDGTWILALADGFYRFDLENGVSTLIAHTKDANPANRMNDGKCDPSGRFWAGTMSAKWQRDANLYMLDNGQLSHRLSEVGCSNGLAWNADATIMYYIDSFERIVYAFDYDAATGAISNRRPAITYPDIEGEGGPDGMSIDAEGMLWIGHWGGSQVGRWNPLTGEKLATIPIPVLNVTSCAFGGVNLDELYITTARVGNDEAALRKQPQAGGLFRVKLDVAGLPVHRAKV